MWTPAQLVANVRRGVVALAARSPAVGVPMFLAERVVWEAAHRAKGACPAGWAPVLERLTRDGVAVLPGHLPRERCDVLRAEVDRLLEAESARVHRRGDARLYGAERASQMVRAFHDDPDLLALARAWRGPDVVNAMTLAAALVHRPGVRASSGPGWHRDGWFRQVKAFVFLTDVSEANGPLQVIAGSHRAAARARDMRRHGQRFKQYDFTDAEVGRLLAAEPERLVTAAGPAGTLVLADTSAIHRGRPIEAGARYALTNYYYPAADVGELYRYFAPTLHDAG